MIDDKFLHDELQAAVLKRDVVKLEKIMASLNLPDDLSEWMFGSELLSTAIQTGNEEIIKFLLARNVPVNDNGENEHTPLYFAVKYGLPEIVKKLLKKADIDKNKYSENVLDIAMSVTYPSSYSNNEKILEILVDHVSDNNITDQIYTKLLNHLINKGAVELSEKLLSKCLHIDLSKAMKTYNFLCAAVEKRSFSIVKLLLARGVDVNFIDYRRLNPMTALYMTCRTGDDKMVKFLLINGARTDIKNGLVIHCNTLSYFSSYYYPIHGAIKYNVNPKILELLLDHGANINQKFSHTCGCQSSAIVLACSESSKQIVETLINRGVDINFKDEKGDSLVMYAFNNKNKEVFDYVLSHPDLKELDYRNIEHILRTAVRFCQAPRVQKIIGYLQQQDPYSSLRHEVDVNLFSDRIYSPILHTAAVCGSRNSHFKPLIRYGADVNFSNSVGKTPLHSAFQFRRLGSIKILLQLGADINVICDAGYTPLDYGLEDNLFEERKHKDPNSNYISKPNEVEDIVDFFNKYIVKRKLLNLYVNKKISDALITRRSYPGRSLKTGSARPCREQEYKEEIEKMKLEIISDGITYYDFVTADLFTVITFLNNDDILEILESEKYKITFPHYWEIISGCIWRGYARKRLLNKVSDHPIFKPIFELPYPCFREIMNYFSNGDLKEFLDNSVFYFHI